MNIGNANLNNASEYLKLFSSKNTKQASAQSANKSEAAIVRQYQLADPHNYGIPGMDITGKHPSEWQKIIDVSDDIKEKVTNLARKEFINNYDATDGEELSALIRNYVLSIPEKDRSAASFTLGEVFGEECARLREIVQSKDSQWQVGQPFDRSIFSEYLSGNENYLDKKI